MTLYKINRDLNYFDGRYMQKLVKDTICTIGNLVKNYKIVINFSGQHDIRTAEIDFKYFTDYTEKGKIVQSFFDIIPKYMTKEEREEREKQWEIERDEEKERNRVEEEERKRVEEEEERKRVEEQESYNGGRRTKRLKKQYIKKQSKKNKRLKHN